MATEQVIEDIKFLMSFVDYLDVETFPIKACPTFYFTLTQEGDESLASKVALIRKRYGIAKKTLDTSR